MAKAKTKKQEAEQKSFLLLAYGIFALAMTYSFASWAIDTGNLILYLLTYISIYYAISYLVQFVKVQFFNNGKVSKAKKSKK